MRQIASRAFFLSLLTALTVGPVTAQDRTHVVIVVGLGGTTEFRESFHAEAAQIYTAVTDLHGLPIPSLCSLPNLYKITNFE